MSTFNTHGLESIYKLYKTNLNKDSDAIVVFVHWYLIKNAFKCVNDDGTLSEILSNDWNADDQVYIIKYTRESKGYELKILEIEENLMINLARLKDGRLASVTIKTSDLVVNFNNDFDRVYKNLNDFYEKLQNEVEALINDQKETKKIEAPKKQEQTQRDVIDPLRVIRPTDTRPLIDPRVDPRNYGRSDLDPFNFNPLGGGGGMVFDPFRTGQGGLRGPRLPGTADFPPGSIPPGARYYPTHPFNPDNPMGSSRFEPNPDHLRPPGYDDMFM